ncbi:MAG TPA: alpha/beta hydrolase [Gemmatimonadaceae bacterium]|nr:alpha/beta hydrolase [Gemmatimonadaceae bacterium]
MRSGVQVRVVERGNPNALPVVLIHGWGCSAYIFRYNLPALADAGYRPIAVDLKGHGLSDKPGSKMEYSAEALVDHIRDILDALGIARARLVGHSMGGVLVYLFASRFPERVESLGLLSPVGLTGVPLMWLYRLLTPEWLAPFVHFIRPRAAVRIALKRVYGKRGTFTTRDVEEYVAPFQFPDYAPAMRALLHEFDWEAARHHPLPKVTTRAAGVFGTLDHLMPRDGMAIYEKLVPGIPITPIIDAGHVTTEETPDEVNSVLCALLGGKERAPAILQMNE